MISSFPSMHRALRGMYCRSSRCAADHRASLLDGKDQARRAHINRVADLFDHSACLRGKARLDCWSEIVMSHCNVDIQGSVFQ